MSDLANWQPARVISKWLDKTRRNRATTTETLTAKKQPLFNGIFWRCDEENENNDSDDETQNNENLF